MGSSVNSREENTTQMKQHEEMREKEGEEDEKHTVDEETEKKKTAKINFFRRFGLLHYVTKQVMLSVFVAGYIYTRKVHVCA